MTKWLEWLDWSLTVSAFLYITIKTPLMGVSWPEVIGIALVLIVHYARNFAPRRTLLIPDVNEIQKAIADLEDLKKEIEKVKLAQGFSRIGGK